MISIRTGQADDAGDLANLVLASAPILLPYLFNGEQQAKQYIEQSSRSNDGQYSANRHCIADGNLPTTPASTDAGNNTTAVLGCMTLWHSNMGTAFELATINSLKLHLTGTQIRHLLNINPMLTSVFQSPKENELCMGHLAVLQNARGSGVGKKLVAYALKQAKRLNKSSLVLDVDQANHEALSFYEGCDFVVSSKALFTPTEQTFLRMQYVL